MPVYIGILQVQIFDIHCKKAHVDHFRYKYKTQISQSNGPRRDLEALERLNGRIVLKLSLSIKYSKL